MGFLFPYGLLWGGYSGNLISLQQRRYWKDSATVFCLLEEEAMFR